MLLEFLSVFDGPLIHCVVVRLPLVPEGMELTSNKVYDFLYFLPKPTVQCDDHSMNRLVLSGGVLLMRLHVISKRLVLSGGVSPKILDLSGGVSPKLLDLSGGVSPKLLDLRGGVSFKCD